MADLRQWHEERNLAWLYRGAADAERDPERRRRFASLAEASEARARRIEEQASAAAPRRFRPLLRTRLALPLVRRLGPQTGKRFLSALGIRGLRGYAAAPSGHPMPTSADQVGRSHVSVTSGGNLRAAVFGINDGLVSNTSLIMGVAGATGETGIILISGVAGLLAGAFSMAAGEYISVSSQRELFEAQIRREREEIARFPQEETEEIALIYNARGVPLPEAREIAKSLMRDPEHALETHVREELGLNPEDLGSPLGAASSSFAAFALGGFLPLLPFVLALERHAVLIAALLAGTALFSVGMLINLLTGQRLLWGGLRMLLIGGSAATVTYLIGTLLGVSLA